MGRSINRGRNLVNAGRPGRVLLRHVDEPIGGRVGEVIRRRHRRQSGTGGAQGFLLGSHSNRCQRVAQSTFFHKLPLFGMESLGLPGKVYFTAV